MTISADELDKINQLAYLKTDLEPIDDLVQEISSIMDFVEQLRSLDTKGVAPLYHPFDLHQSMRKDAITEESCLEELRAIAPLFEDDYYLVPQVIESGK